MTGELTQLVQEAFVVESSQYRRYERQAMSRGDVRSIIARYIELVEGGLMSARSVLESYGKTAWRGTPTTLAWVCTVGYVLADLDREHPTLYDAVIARWREYFFSSLEGEQRWRKVERLSRRRAYQLGMDWLSERFSILAQDDPSFMLMAR